MTNKFDVATGHMLLMETVALYIMHKNTAVRCINNFKRKRVSERTCMW